MDNFVALNYRINIFQTKIISRLRNPLSLYYYELPLWNT